MKKLTLCINYHEKARNDVINIPTIEDMVLHEFCQWCETLMSV